MQLKQAQIVYLDSRLSQIQLITELPDMKKIVISWWTPSTDFLQGTKKSGVNQAGPNLELHQYFFDAYDKHILLCSSKGDDTRFEFLCNEIRLKYPKHSLDARYLALNDITDFFEIKTKVEPILWEHRAYQIHLFFTPGTSSMSIVWFLLHQQLGLNTILMQTIKRENSKNGQPDIKYLSIEKEEALSSFLIKQADNEKAIKTTLRDEKNYLIGTSIEPIYKIAATVAQADRGNILILGESGTGKEHLAQFIHESSARVKQPFLTINCAAFGDTLLESRLFGHKKGAFTGALDNHKGYFEEANRGTIFLDEIGDISPYMQQLLLRVLQNGEIAPIGGKPKQVDVRIIAATNRDLVQHCEAGRFRWDLYYRLATMELEIPSLLNRGQKELKQLLYFFIAKKQQLFGRAKPIKISADAERQLLQYAFPGNVRELESLVERFYILGEKEIKPKHFPKRMLGKTIEGGSLLLKDIETAHILRVLTLKDNNLSQTAETLGIALNTLKRKLKE